MFCLESLKGVSPEIFHQEVSLLYRFSKYPYFCQLLGFEDEKMTMLLKFYQHGPLSIYLFTKSNFWSKFFALSIALDISRGLQILHESDVVHCDVKLDNILLEYDESANVFHGVITDFGIARILTAPEDMKVKHFTLKKIRAASVYYASPELMVILGLGGNTPKRDNRPPDVVKSADVYAFGCMLSALMTRRKIWSK